MNQIPEKTQKIDVKREGLSRVRTYEVTTGVGPRRNQITYYKADWEKKGVGATDNNKVDYNPWI